MDTKVQARGGTTEALHILAREEGDGLLDVVADLLVKVELKTRTRFTVTVNRGRSIEEMVADGKYDFANPNITAVNFPITGTGTCDEEEILVHFDRSIESDDAVREMNQLDLEPSPIEDVLAFGAKYPDVQREFPIVGLGSSWMRPLDGRVCVPVLDCVSDERSLYLDRRAPGWSGHYRFLARRKRQKPLGTGTL